MGAVLAAGDNKSSVLVGKRMGNGNGSVALTRLVWWAIGIGAVIVIGGGAFFAPKYLGGMDERITANTTGREQRTAWINTLEGRIAALENTGAASLAAIKDSLAKMETW